MIQGCVDRSAAYDEVLLLSSAWRAVSGVDGSHQEMHRLSPEKNNENISPRRKAWNSRIVPNLRGRGVPDNGRGIHVQIAPREGEGMICLCLEQINRADLQQVGPRIAMEADLALDCAEKMRSLHHCRVLRAVCTNICQNWQ